MAVSFSGFCESQMSSGKRRLSPPPLWPSSKRLETGQGRENEPGTTIHSLYDELILCVFSHLSWIDLCVAQATCRTWARLATDNQVSFVVSDSCGLTYLISSSSGRPCISKSMAVVGCAVPGASLDGLTEERSSPCLDGPRHMFTGIGRRCFVSVRIGGQVCRALPPTTHHSNVLHFIRSLRHRIIRRPYSRLTAARGSGSDARLACRPFDDHGVVTSLSLSHHTAPISRWNHALVDLWKDSHLGPHMHNCARARPVTARHRSLPPPLGVLLLWKYHRL